MTQSDKMMAVRKKLPTERISVNRRFQINYFEDEADPDRPGQFKKVPKALKLYVVVGMYDDHTIGELFYHCDDKNLLRGALEQHAIAFSMALQHGVPLKELTDKMRATQFGPRQQFGMQDADFQGCTSIFDLVGKWLDLRFPDGKYDPKAIAGQPR